MNPQPQFASAFSAISVVINQAFGASIAFGVELRKQIDVDRANALIDAPRLVWHTENVISSVGGAVGLVAQYCDEFDGCGGGSMFAYVSYLRDVAADMGGELKASFSRLIVDLSHEGHKFPGKLLGDLKTGLGTVMANAKTMQVTVEALTGRDRGTLAAAEESYGLDSPGYILASGEADFSSVKTEAFAAMLLFAAIAAAQAGQPFMGKLFNVKNGAAAGDGAESTQPAVLAA